MSNYLDVDGSPMDVRAVGAQLQAQATAFNEQAQEILGEISTIEDGQPWGNDHFGTSFKEQYFRPVEDGAPVSDAIKDNMVAVGEELDRTGAAIMGAMDDYERTDTQNSSDIANVRD
jgi:hypothetical protein